MQINEIQDQIIAEFGPCKESIEKYKKLLEVAKQVEPLNNEYKTDKNIIRGCQSNAWVVINETNNKLAIKGDVDAMITKGIMALILKVYNEQKPSDIINSDLYFLDKIGLKQSLSPQRANGVKAIVDHIQRYAKNCVE